MTGEGDWRLEALHEPVQGLVYRRRQWSSPDPRWDHDHCAFCWQKLGPEEMEDAQSVGYATDDLATWICEACFADFRAQFDLRAADA